MRRRLVVFTLVAVSVGVLLLHVMQVQLDISQVSLAETENQQPDLVLEDFVQLPVEFLDRIRAVSSATSTVYKATTNAEVARSPRLENRTNAEKPSLWPMPFSSRDRIVDQLNYRLEPSAKRKPKEIFTSSSSFYTTERFQKDNCLVKDCIFTHQSFQRATADVVVNPGPRWAHKTGQIWMSYLLEAPPNAIIFTPSGGPVNWTATYRTDSTIVAPYERFVTFANVTKLPEKPTRNYALGKTKQAAWFVSNCATSNGRLQYVQELQKYIQVDIYGSCGNLTCRRSDATNCFRHLEKHYKFYLSFENSNCKDYITEKFYWNAL